LQNSWEPMNISPSPIWSKIYSNLSKLAWKNLSLRPLGFKAAIKTTLELRIVD
jgi:hypothetical protein